MPKPNRQLAEYAESHDRCAVCYWRKGRPGRRMEVHHIQGRRGKTPHDPRGLIMLCDECHYGVHSGGGKSLDVCEIMGAKEEEDGSVDQVYLAGMRGKKGMPCDPRPVPAWARDERIDNRHR